MTRASTMMSLLVVAGFGCRGSRGPDHSTGVGNPGNMTVELGPTTDLVLDTTEWSVSRVAVRLCDDVEVIVESSDAPFSVDGAVSIELPGIGGSSMVCGLRVDGGQPLVVEGEGAGGGVFDAALAVGPIEVDFAVPLAIDSETRLELILGAEGWLDAAWLGLDPAAPVTIDVDHPQHDAIVDRLSTASVSDRQTGEVLATTEDVAAVPLSLHVTVGYGGWMMGSFDDGRTWSQLRAPDDDAPSSHLYGVAAAPGTAESPVLVAVGGEEEGLVVVSTDGSTFEARSIATFGLRDVVWDAGQFIAVGRDGRVATSTDGDDWALLDPLGDCHFSSVAAKAGVVVAVGTEDGTSGCVWRSEDLAQSFEVLAALSTPGLRVTMDADDLVVIGEDGKLNHMPTGGSSWSTLVVDDPYLHDVVLRDGWVKVLGDDGVYYVEDWATVVPGETAGFVRWVPTLDDRDLLAVTEDGEVYRSPRADATALADWADHGDVGRSELGQPLTDVVRWIR